MNIFKSWKESTDKALEKLKELEKNNSDAITEDCSIYRHSKEDNFIVTNEIVALYEYGLGVVFEVKQKPKFCFDALIRFILGVVQVQKNLESYAPIVKLQREYDYSHENPGKYDITGGTKKETDAALQEYFERTKNIGGDENMIIRTYHLGFVGKSKSSEIL
ncbi:hypothetical protein AOLI_G00202540 [Acnodon oligacanthus]